MVFSGLDAAASSNLEHSDLACAKGDLRLVASDDFDGPIRTAPSSLLWNVDSADRRAARMQHHDGAAAQSITLDGAGYLRTASALPPPDD